MKEKKKRTFNNKFAILWFLCYNGEQGVDKFESKNKCRQERNNVLRDSKGISNKRGNTQIHKGICKRFSKS